MSEIATSSVEYPSNGITAMGYLAHSKNGSGPAVVVIQEWWGLDAHIRDVAERFAREGYVALAPSSTTRVHPYIRPTRRKMPGRKRSGGSRHT